MIDAVTASYYLMFVQIFVHWSLRESSFNMTRGDEDSEGGGPPQEIFRHPKGGSEKLGRGLRKFVYFKTNRREGGGGLLKNRTASEGAAKISSFEFQYLHPPPPVI